LNNPVVIKVNNISKEYHIGKLQNNSDRLGEQVIDMVIAPARRAKKILQGRATGAAELDESIWALKDISFEIRAGEVVGIIGRNGAGKSTLLKILSRITEPTKGYADLYGRVGSLLEVGTGFHPELTGRENIFLNGAILGMTRVEIRRKFDAIVDFAEIEKFIDTPVKHYSSGMYVRLAFSVAAHLDPEILLVDEVLAVGDLAFQRKSLGKMDDVANQGRTVIFVSHNMGLIQTLCHRGIFLQDGQIHADGPIEQAIESYIHSLEEAEENDLRDRVDRKGHGHSRLIGIDVNGGSNGKPGAIRSGSYTKFVVSYDRILPGMACNIFIFDSIGQPVTNFESRVRSSEDIITPSETQRFICEVDELMLRPGRYRVDLALIGDSVLQDYIEAATLFNVGDGQIQGRPAPTHKKFRVFMPHRWQTPDSK
jgi:lipopolysaccharide transport system ATP-binding protein